MLKKLFGRESLVRLSQDNKYVFHGSPDPGVKMFTPGQARSRGRDADGNKLEDQNRVYATTSIDVAVFVAVVFHQGESGWYININKGNVTYSFHANPDVVERAKMAEGYVYIFDKDLFQQASEGSTEYFSERSVTPLAIVRVTARDLRPELTLLTPDPNPNH